jgi:uncharacterized ferritin-like protein (DUF455 family)
MSLYTWAESILLDSSLEAKLHPYNLSEAKFQKKRDSSIVDLKRPNRESRHAINNRQDKFPKKGSFGVKENRAKAMHFFANHELLALEMMAAAILYYPTLNEDDFLLKKGIANALMDEQKHFSLYVSRMNILGVEFGDFSINDFFWRYFKEARTIQEFVCMMSLTFESANLDFSLFYRDAYQEFDDQDSARIMQEVYEDEISHVALGVNWIKKWLKSSEHKTIWDFYLNNLPKGLSPARAKGTMFDKDGRSKSGLPSSFLTELDEYRDNFSVVNRSSWNSK